MLSSSVTMLVPFCIGKLIDLIYNSTEDFTEMLWNLKLTCAGLSVVFLIGAVANLGRVFIVQTTGRLSGIFLLIVSIVLCKLFHSRRFIFCFLILVQVACRRCVYNFNRI